MRRFFFCDSVSVENKTEIHTMRGKNVTTLYLLYFFFILPTNVKWMVTKKKNNKRNF